MAIRLEKMIKEEDNRAAGYLWTKESDPTWLRYQVDLTNGQMKGYHVSKCEGAIPRMIPFLYNFPQVAQARASHLFVAAAIFADIGKENVVKDSSADVVNMMAQNVSAFEAFMNTFDRKKEGTGKKNADVQIERTISIDSEIWDSPHAVGLVRWRKNDLLEMPRNRFFRVGQPMSGFDTYKEIMSKRHPDKLKIASMGQPNIEQARSALKSVSRPSSRAVSWYGVNDPEKAKYRLQAAASMPLLAAMIAESKSLSDAVDKLEQVSPILSERTGLGKGSLKRIGKITAASPASPIFEAGERIQGEDALGVNRARHTKISGSVPVDKTLKYLSELPPDRTPQDDESWLRFNDILTAIAIPLSNATGMPVADFLEPSKGDWIGFHALLAKGADFEPEAFDRRTMALVCIDALEAIDHFNRTVMLPQALISIQEKEQPEPMLTREFILSGIEASTHLILGQSKNIPLMLMEMSRRYASRIPAMMELEGKSMLERVVSTAERFAAYGENGFPLMTAEFTASNGLVVRPLINGFELSRESERLAHCVGTYQSKARKSDCHIYSIQNADGSQSYSTIEYAGLHGEDPIAAVGMLRCVQHRGTRNGTPSDECKIAFDEFTAAVKNGQIPVNLKEIQEWREYILANGPKISSGPIVTNWKSVLEIDWEDDTLRSSYWAEWGHVLGGKFAKSPTPGVVYTEKRAQELVAAMSPRTAAIMIEEARLAREAKLNKSETQSLEP